MRSVAISVALVLGLAGLAHAHKKVGYRSTILVSDEADEAPVVDANLVNAWGIAQNPSGPWWVANNGTGTSTLYDGAGTRLPLVVTVPAADGGTGGVPTGIVFYGGSAFKLKSGASARFIFATEDGTFSAWAPGSTAAEITFSDEGSAYKALAIHGDTLYTTDFTECGVEAFDGNWDEMETDGGFADRSIPAGYCPFGIQVIGNSVFVTYALADGIEDVAGRGHGFVREFDLDGHLIARVADRGRLNSPWGVAMAPGNFGAFSGCLIVGNFGDGKLNAYCRDRHWRGWFHPAGRLREGHHDLVVDGLWGIAFGNGNGMSPTNTLFFAAGPDEETHGYFGKIEVARPDQCMEDD